MEMQLVARSLAALAHEHRLRTFRLLVVAGTAGMTPGALGDVLQIPSTTLSFHLKELTNAGLVHQERVGRHLVYRAAFRHMDELLAFLTRDCCDNPQRTRAAAACAALATTL
jgi:ArsR family transcriptional regulator